MAHTPFHRAQQNPGLLGHPLQSRPMFGQHPQNIWNAVQRFLIPETPAETAALVGTSLGEPAGTVIDATDLYIGLRDRDLPRAGFAGAGLLLPMVSGRLMREGGSRTLDAIADGADELPMDEASRLARKEEWLEPSSVQDRVYHGTTHNIDEFDPQMGHADSHHGKSLYFSSSPTDVQTNYARADGPDLTAHYESKVDEIMNRLDLSYENPGDVAMARSQAEAMVKGPHEGATIPAHLRLKNPVDTRPGGTYFDFKQAYDEALDEWDEPEGELLNLIEAMRRVAEHGVGGTYHGWSLDEVVSEIFETAMDEGGISAEAFEKIIRQNNSMPFIDAVDPLTDEMIGTPGEFLRRVYMEAGFDGTIVDADATFGSGARFFQRMGGGLLPMKGMEGVEGAIHYAVFEPQNILSPFAMFDLSRMGCANIGAGLAGLLAAGSIRSRDRDNYVER